jgi:hypothetical protein
MDLAVDGAGDGVIEAVRTAVAQAGVALLSRPPSDRSAWWRAGLADAVERGVVSPERSWGYDVARSPRNTRGAARA